MANKKRKSILFLTQESLLKRLSNYEATMQKRAGKYYISEARRLDKEIASFYQKYGSQNVINYKNIMAKMSDGDRALILHDFDAFAAKYPQYANLYNLRLNIYKLNRLEGLQASIRVQQLNIGAYESQQVEQHLKKVGAETFEEMSRLLGHEYRNEIVQKFVDKLSAVSVAQIIFGNRLKLAEYLATDIAQGLARGDSYERLSNNITERFKKVSKRDMDRLVYTQGTLVFNEATAGVVEEDFEEYRISTIGDSKVCDICRGFEQRTFRFSDRKVGVNFPPFHPWCRCSFEVVVTDRQKWIDDYVKKHSGNNPGSPKPDNPKKKPDSVDIREQAQDVLDTMTDAPVSVTDKYKRINGKHTWEDDLKATNPNYKKSKEAGDGLFTKNCQRCVIAYEARRRGFDVTAKERDFKDGSLSKMRNPNGWPACYEHGHNWLQRCKGETGEAQKAIADKKIQEWGDGSRGIVRVQWKNVKSGHVFIAENHGGKVVYIDPQNGSTDCSKYFQYIRPNCVNVLRTDDKNFTDLMDKCVE